MLTPEEKRFFGIYTTKEHFEILFGHKELLNILIKSNKKFLESTILEKTQEKNLECLCDVSTH